jgi:hypothetical protein
VVWGATTVWASQIPTPAARSGSTTAFGTHSRPKQLNSYISWIHVREVGSRSTMDEIYFRNTPFCPDASRRKMRILMTYGASSSRNSSTSRNLGHPQQTSTSHNQQDAQTRFRRGHAAGLRFRQGVGGSLSPELVGPLSQELVRRLSPELVRRRRASLPRPASRRRSRRPRCATPPGGPAAAPGGGRLRPKP